MLGLQEATIMGECLADLISPPKYPNPCANGGVLEPQVLMVHKNSPGINRWSGQPISRNNRSSDQLYIYISWLSNRHAYRSDSRPIIEDS